MLTSNEKSRFPISAELSTELSAARFGAPFDGTLPARFADSPWDEKEIENIRTGFNSWLHAFPKAVQVGATDKEAMKEALRGLEQRQGAMRAREATIQAQGFTYNGKTGHFEKRTERGLLSLHRAEDGTPALTLTDANREVGTWPIDEDAADLARAVEAASQH